MEIVFDLFGIYNRDSGDEMSLQQVIEKLNPAQGVDIGTPLLPTACVRYQASAVKATFTMVRSYDRLRVRLQDSNKEYNLPGFNILIECTCDITKNGYRIRVEETYVSVFFGDLEDGTRMYHYPYGNAYDGGTICWGTANPNKLKVESYTMDMLFGLLINTPANDDLRLLCDYKRDIQSWFEHLDGADKIPVEKLSPLIMPYKK